MLFFAGHSLDWHWNIMTVVHFVVLFLYIRHHRHHLGQDEYGHLDSDATDQEKSKAEAVWHRLYAIHCSHMNHDYYIPYIQLILFFNPAHMHLYPLTRVCNLCEVYMVCIEDRAHQCRYIHPHCVSTHYYAQIFVRACGIVFTVAANDGEQSHRDIHDFVFPHLCKLLPELVLWYWT